MNITRLTDSNLCRTRLAKLRELVRHPSLWRATVRGTVPSFEHSAVPFRDDFRTVIDVGASRGQFALFATRRFPNATVICFEPLDKPANILERVTGQRVEVRRVALGEELGEATIHISGQDDSSSLLPIGERQVAEFPGTAEVDTRETTVSTLDDEFPAELDRPCLLKIDVQGFEAKVLKGGRTLLRQVDEALIECSYIELYKGQALAPEVIEIMERAGFSLILEEDGRPGSGRVQADLLFRRRPPA